eukprot:1670568-Pyramimonas_sp.AAC.3
MPTAVLREASIRAHCPRRATAASDYPPSWTAQFGLAVPFGSWGEALIRRHVHREADSSAKTLVPAASTVL